MHINFTIYILNFVSQFLNKQYNFNNKMGINQSVDSCSNFQQLKRQSHSILGEVTLIKEQCSNKIFHKKQIKQAPSAPPKTLLSANHSIKEIKPFLQIHHMNYESHVLMACSSEQLCTVIIDSVEVDLQTIQNSSLFHGFTQDNLLNIMCNILQAIVILNGSKLGVFPISPKSVFLSGIEEYQGQDLSKVTFKVVPVELVRSQNIKQYHNTIIVPPEQFEAFHFFKQQMYLSFTPKNHIYSLGVMILNFIYAQQNRAVDISFGNSSVIMLNSQFNSEQIKRRQKSNDEVANMLSVLQFSPNFSLEFKKIIPYMVKIQEQSRIGLTCLFDRLRSIKIKTFQERNKQVNTIKTVKFSQNQNQTLTKRRSKRTMSGLVFPIQQKQIFQNQQPKTNKNNYYKMRQQGFISSAKKKKVTNLQPLKNVQNVPEYHSQRIKFQNGAIYDGQVDDFNNFNGFGTLYYNDKHVCYTGYWKNNRFHGFGYLFNNSIYQKSQNLRQGQTKRSDLRAINKQGQKLWERYEGQFKDDLKHGYGILYFIDGSKFQGQFIDDKAHGSGNFINNNKDIVNGLWHNNRLIKQYQ